MRCFDTHYVQPDPPPEGHFFVVLATQALLDLAEAASSLPLEQCVTMLTISLVDEHYQV